MKKNGIMDIGIKIAAVGLSLIVGAGVIKAGKKWTEHDDFEEDDFDDSFGMEETP